MKLKKKLVIVITAVCLVFRPMPLHADQSIPETAQDASQPAGQEPAGNNAVRLALDSQNCYDGMDKPYSQGYVPRVEGGSVYLVAPILSSGTVKDQCLRVSLDLGDTQNTPFVVKNYEKNIRLQQVSVNGGSGTAECYVAAFSLELSAERCNGSYPVVVKANAEGETGNEVTQEFTIYVNITDGKDPNAGALADEPVQEPEAPPVFAPKVMVQSCQFSKPDIQAGDEVTADITLVNTSRTQAIRNMTVTVTAPAEQFTLMSQSDTVYIDALAAGGTVTVSYQFQINAAAPQGQYDLELAMDYADTKGNSYTAGGKARVSVEQLLSLQFDPLVIPAQVEVADVIEVSAQVMNLGRSKVYNVRAVIEADGLTPQGTIFIGDVEPGTMASAGTQVTVSSMSEDGRLYGATEGTVTFYYEDDAGREQTESMTFVTSIQSPFSGDTQVQEEEKGQWWIIMAVIGGVLGAFAALIIVRKVRRRQQDETVEEILEA
ncbi:MAG: hypothetical protein K2N01_12025 [Lachnospiraceae bacterium]|nr:hypothetical protein [Lachnospiraceae bacterium]